MSERLIETLMKRDNLTYEQASELVKEARSNLQSLLNEGLLDEAYYICQTMFGLEPDYLEDLI